MRNSIIVSDLGSLIRHGFYSSVFALSLATSSYAADVSGDSLKDPLVNGASAISLQEMDKTLRYRGWDFPFPSFSDTVTQDAGGIRSTLASYGIGFLGYSSANTQENMLNTPRVFPSKLPGALLPLPACKGNYNQTGGLCAGGQAYPGEGVPTVASTVQGYLTYDTSRYGIPDGLVTIGGALTATNEEWYIPSSFRLSLLSYYQTAFNKRLEIEAGYLHLYDEFVGPIIAGILANPFGPTIGIPVQLGFGTIATVRPAFRETFHITGDQWNGLYNEAAIQQSTAVRPTPAGLNFLEAETYNNPTGFNWSAQSGLGAVYVDEMGWRQTPAPGKLSQWFRAGYIYNSSEYNSNKSLNPLKPNLVNGSWGTYVLADHQILQTGGADPRFSYQGIYVGGTWAHADPLTISVENYYEGRLYWLAPFPSRPQDMFSLVYARNDLSKYIYTNPTNLKVGDLFGEYFNNYLDAASVTYAYKLATGMTLAGSLTYSTNPSAAAFKGEGNALFFKANIFVAF